MKVELLTFDKYTELGLRASNVFGMTEFLRLNAYKAHRLIAVIADKKVGLVFGESHGVIRAPWSAPYMTVAMKPGEAFQPNYYRDFGFEAREIIEKEGPLRLVTPPEIYQSPELPFFEGFRRETDAIVEDTSFYIRLKDAIEETGWNKSARRNLRKGINAGLTWCLNDDARECYRLISRHHDALGYTMAMTEEQVMATAKIIPVDFWVVKLGKIPVAAMYCYRVRNNTVQVISSGDTPEGREVGAAMFIERTMIDYYRRVLVGQEGFADALLDHGPTSVGGIQNEGLAAFKTSFGCSVTMKRTLSSSSH